MFWLVTKLHFLIFCSANDPEYKNNKVLFLLSIIQQKEYRIWNQETWLKFSNLLHPGTATE